MLINIYALRIKCFELFYQLTRNKLINNVLLEINELTTTI